LLAKSVYRSSADRACTVVLVLLRLPLSPQVRMGHGQQWATGTTFLAAAGAAAVLAGLVFVGVPIHLNMLMSNPAYALVNRALEALILLMAVLIVTCLLLVPV
jgi:hypothetical protein